MDPLKVLRLYLALYAHYNHDGYDIVKYAGRVKNCNETTLNSNKPRRILIDRLAQRFKSPSEVMGYLVPQWIYAGGQSLYNASIAEDHYNRWQRFRIGSTHLLISDLHDKDLYVEPVELLKYVLTDHLKIESLIALQKMYSILPKQDYFVFNQLWFTINKSTPFVVFDQSKLEKEIDYEKAAATV